MGTPPAQARRASAIIDGDETIGIPVVVLLETAHVLRTQYDVPRRTVLNTLIKMVTRENIEVLGLARDAVIEALLRARTIPGAPLPDALVVATVADAGALPLYSFDKGMGRHGVPLVAP